MRGRHNWSKAKARSVRSGLCSGPNKTEQKFADEILCPLKLSGLVVQYDYEPETFHLAPNVRFNPDWRVIWADRTIEFIEVKAADKSGKILHDGDSIVKLRMAMDMNWMYGWRLAARLPKSAGSAWKFRQTMELGIRPELTEAGWPIIEETFEGQALKRDSQQ